MTNGAVVIVPAALHHAFVLSTTMRQEDVRELDACGRAPLEGLLEPLQLSEAAWAALYGDVVGAMFGVIPLPQELSLGAPRRAVLWFLTAHLFGQKPIAFTRAARAVAESLRTQYDELVNVIDSRYTAALRFAVAMGAQFGGEVPMGPERIPFVAFRLGRL